MHLDQGVNGSLGTKDAGVTGTHGSAGTSGALGTTKAGVHAQSIGANPALLVEGGMHLADGGTAVVPKGKDSVRSSGWKILTAQAAVAVLQVHRPGVAVAAAVVDRAAGTVTIYLTKKVTVATPVAYFLFGTDGMK
jgi:hypothetical protein